jgi:hypothetical protein
MRTYHNTIVFDGRAESPDMWMARGATAERPRSVHNNVFLHLGPLPKLRLADTPGLVTDGNLYWQPGLDSGQAATFFSAWRASPAFELSKKAYPPGFESHSLAADPKFFKIDAAPLASNDYRPQQGSPLIDAGVELPADWPDAVRAADKGKPDVGALPFGAEPWKVGRQ